MAPLTQPASRPIAAVALAAALAMAGGAHAAAPSPTVVWQVTYADGRVRDLDSPPTTSAGIRGVLRIARVPPAPGAARVLATGPESVRQVGAGSTAMHELRWNGTAWVAPPGPRPRAREACSS